MMLSETYVFTLVLDLYMLPGLLLEWRNKKQTFANVNIDPHMCGDLFKRHVLNVAGKKEGSNQSCSMAESLSSRSNENQNNDRERGRDGA